MKVLKEVKIKGDKPAAKDIARLDWKAGEEAVKDIEQNKKMVYSQSIRERVRQNRLEHDGLVEAETLSQMLDLFYENNRRAMQRYVNTKGDTTKGSKRFFQPDNLLIIGQPGGGKTSIIESWAEANDIPLLALTGSALTPYICNGLPAKVEMTLDGQVVSKAPQSTGNAVVLGNDAPDTATKTRSVQQYLPSTVFDSLEDKGGKATVLFIDEINRAPGESQASLLNLIQDHEISDFYWEEPETAGKGGKKGMRKFHTFLFTVAACNPPKGSKDVENIGEAMYNRFSTYIWDSNPKETAKFWNDVLDTAERAAYKGLEDMEEGSQEYIDKKEDGDLEVQWSHGCKRILDILIKKGFQFEDGAKKYNADGTFSVDAQSLEPEAQLGMPPKTMSARSLGTIFTAINGQIGIPDKNGRYNPETFLGKAKGHCSPSFFRLLEQALLPEAKREIRLKQGAPTSYAQAWLDYKAESTPIEWGGDDGSAKLGGHMS